MTSAPTRPDRSWLCASEGCARRAVEALKFAGQEHLGHIHDCGQHAALLREWTAVTASATIGPDGVCPWPECYETGVIAYVTPTQL